MRVAIAARTITPIDRGGIQNHVRYIGEDMAARGVVSGMLRARGHGVVEVW